MNRNLLIETLSVQSTSYAEQRMKTYLKKKLKAMPGVGWKTDSYGNIYAWKGNADFYPCLVSHMDTVHPIINDFQVKAVKKSGKDWLMGWDAEAEEQTGIGGDDKVGVYLCLELLSQLPDVKVAFFSNEETGLEGSIQADLTFFNDCIFVLQCDRRGNSDFVRYIRDLELFPLDFGKKVMSILYAHGYGISEGGGTDVYALKTLGVAAPMANISCGYYDPHTPFETVCVNDVANCLDLLLAIAAAFEADKNYINHPASVDAEAFRRYLAGE